ncbi:hypothetical protein QQF64_028976 [Cirrhinus molitorella]|uniref:Uncharacterized protein n=1 Tax=Cirrhinus molitorella TaxID=172907 RepID=A0ABR3N8D6_9TELE
MNSLFRDCVIGLKSQAAPLWTSPVDHLWSSVAFVSCRSWRQREEKEKEKEKKKEKEKEKERDHQALYNCIKHSPKNTGNRKQDD